MAFAEQSKFYVNFTEGLNTDFTRLNFPQNAATDLDNVNIFRTGKVSRRLGVEFEDGYQLSNNDFDSAIGTNAMSLHEWKAVNGKGDINFLGVQIGATMFFHDLGSEPVSDNLRGSIDLEPFAQGNGVPGDSIMDSSYGEGVMILCNPNMDPVVVSFDEDTQTFSIARIEIEIRDFEGVDDGLEIEERPTGTLSNAHLYNLRNQSWPMTTTVSADRDGDDAIRNIDPVNYTNQKVGFYPSNADLFYAARSGAVDDPEALGAYSPWDLEKQGFGNTRAPRGHFILRAFDQNRQSASGLTGLPDPMTTTVRPSVTAFYAGRVWYAGVPDQKLAGDVFFSQSLTDPENAGKCYQEQDPTAEDLNNLVATDGGVIHIADMGQVYKMLAVGQDLMLVAANGIWAVSGPTGANFAADEFTVRKVTDIGTTSANSVLEAQGSLFFWSRGGIYAVTSGQISDDLDITRISRDRIQTFYEAISEAGKAYARGWYDKYENRVYWLYNDTGSYDAINFRFRYNRVLVLDLTLNGSFTTYTIEDLELNSPFVAGMTQKEPGSESVITYDVVQGLGSSKDNIVRGADDVCEDVAFPVFGDTRLKLLTILQAIDGNYEYTFSEFKSRNFHDWEVWDQTINDPNNNGANYSSYIQGGWDSFGDVIRDKKITHLTCFFDRTEQGYQLVDDEIVFDFPSSCFAQTRWEWTDLDVGRWTKEQQAYRLNRTYIPENDSDPFDYGFEVIKTKLRVRGKGPAFSVRFSSEEGKDFQLVGYAVNVRAGSRV